jgi:hypothetical protein
MISAVLTPAAVSQYYNITYNTANFTITPLSVTVTAEAKTKFTVKSDPVLTLCLIQQWE